METVAHRQAVAQRGKSLEYFTIGWNTLEGLVAILFGVLAGSISLVGFGIDSFIEVASGTVLLWRMSVDSDALKRERNEMLSLRLVGVCFMALALYVGYESVSDLFNRKAPEHSIPGIILACVSRKFLQHLGTALVATTSNKFVPRVCIYIISGTATLSVCVFSHLKLGLGKTLIGGAL
jgi:divalent metal cation (Fe/Co/Zn/Cd) transporter